MNKNTYLRVFGILLILLVSGCIQPEPPKPECTPGEIVCDSGEARILKCDSTGNWQAEETCQANESCKLVDGQPSCEPLTYCGDNICTFEIGETTETCPEDCGTIPPQPSFTFPLQTYGDVRDYSEWLIGDGAVCEEVGGTHSYTGFENEPVQGDYAVSECQVVLEWYDPETKTQPKSGTVTYSVYLDPTDGYIYQLVCNPNYITDCPPRKDWTPKP